MKSTSNTDHFEQLNAAEEALREIYMLCGNNDPSDGEGTSPAEVVEAVKNMKNCLKLNQGALKDFLGDGEIEKEIAKARESVAQADIYLR